MKRIAAGVLAGSLTLATSAVALEIDPNVPPEISLGGRFVATVNGSLDERPSGGDETNADLDISDTSLLLGVSKYIFSDGDYAYGALGLLLPEDDSDLEDDIFIHQAFVGLGGPNYDLRIGRTNLPNTLVTFPTIRDDDLLAFTHVGNAHANVDAEEDQIFGGVVGGTRYFDGGLQASAYGTARAETDLSDLSDKERTSRFNLNGMALGFAYDVPEAIKFDSGFRYAGIALDWQSADALAGGDDEQIVSVLGGISYNLSDDPEATWALDLQGIYTFGDGASDLTTEVGRARADQYSVVTALRYTDRPYLQTNWQAALTFAWKDYADLDDSWSVAVVPSVAWRIGSGIDVLTQYIYRENQSALAAAENLSSSHTLFVGMSFALNATFNESVGTRGSILDLEHDMLNPGPAGLGH